jgi:ribosomal protein S25
MIDAIKFDAINELLEELAKDKILPKLDPLLDVTVSMLSQRIGVATEAARRILQKKVRSGQLTRHLAIMENGYRVMAYRIKSDSE